MHCFVSNFIRRHTVSSINCTFMLFKLKVVFYEKKSLSLVNSTHLILRLEWAETAENYLRSPTNIT